MKTLLNLSFYFYRLSLSPRCYLLGQIHYGEIRTRDRGANQTNDHGPGRWWGPTSCQWVCGWRVQVNADDLVNSQGPFAGQKWQAGLVS